MLGASDAQQEHEEHEEGLEVFDALVADGISPLVVSANEESCF